MKKLFTVILIILCKPAFSQQNNYINYTPNDGLPSSEVYHVIQDSKGYIWFATDNGVSRFDGYEFKNFTTEDGLPDNTVFEIYEDFEGKLWFISFSGRLSYYINGNISLYEFNDSLSKCFVFTPKPIKRGFYIDSNENLYWNDFYNKIIRISKKGEIKKINNKASINVIEEHLFVNDIGNRLLDSLTIYQNNKTYYSDINLHDIKHWKNFKIGVKNKNKIFLGIRNKLYSILEYKYSDEISFSGQIIWLSYQKKTLWVGTSQGLYGFKDGNLSNKPKYSLLHNKSISSVLIDKENSVWITTLNNGIYYIKDLNIKVAPHREELEIATIEKGVQGVLIGLNNGSIGEFFDGEFNFFPKTVSNNSTLLSTKLFTIDSNEVWAISENKIFFIYLNKTSNKSISKYSIKERKSTYSYSFTSIIKDSMGQIWAGNSGQIYKISENLNAPIKTNIKPNPNVFSILETSSNIILFGCKNGVWELDKKKNEYSYWGLGNKVFQNRINDMAYNKEDNSIWFGSKQNGLYIKNADTTLNFNIKNNLKSNFITCIKIHNNTIWVGSKGGGAYKITKNNNKENKYSVQPILASHGLSSNEINDIEINDSVVYFASNKGLDILYHKGFKPNQSPPPIYIDKLSINNNDATIQPTFNLSYNENSFNITLTGLAYKLAGNVKYKYRLSSTAKDTNWINITNRNIQLSYIPPGSYTFQAKAINENNIESETPVEINIKINPPFWKTWWFITILVLVIVLIASIILYAVYKMRIREINKRNTFEKEFIENKNNLEKEIEKFRQQALSQQMNPHFIFNSLNSIQYFIYQNEKTLSNKYLTKFSRLIRMILENSQHQLIPIQDELNALQLYLELEEMRLQGKLNFSIEIDRNINTEFYTIPPLLIQPFAENAIWHGIVNKKENGLLTIKLSEKTDHFICIVEDNGIGREAAKEIQKRKQKTHKSLGASITERRLELFNSTYAEKNKIIFTDLMKNGVPSGTKVEIKIPKFTKNSY